MLDAIDKATPLWFYGSFGALLILLAVTERVIQRGGR